jgi:hypothetical protein
MKQIIGAGLAGLITACKIKDADILEAGQRLERHKALLRFRDTSVSGVTGVPFKKVHVHKAIFYEGEYHTRCNIFLANQYARKVTGAYSADRSIWNLESAERYVAPSDFYDRLVERHSDRISWSTPLARVDRGQPNVLISTIPLPVMLKATGFLTRHLELVHSPIRVARYAIPTDVYQTIYFPDPHVRLFRASISGGILILESTNAPNGHTQAYTEEDELHMAVAAFGIDFYDIDCEQLESVEQKYGKIVEIPREEREAILYELTRDYNVFSIGRFATWRNILLDDVAHDIEQIERLINASAYGRTLAMNTNK